MSRTISNFTCDLDLHTRTEDMSNSRHGNNMVHSVDFGQLASESRLETNDSMNNVLTGGGDHYETLAMNGCHTGCTQSQPSVANTDWNVYSRYIRPCGGFSSQCENDSIIAKSSIPVTPLSLKKHRSAKTKYYARNVILSFVCGLVFGLLLFVVCWLTIDRLNGTKIVCKLNDNGENNDDETAKITTVQRKTTQSQITALDKSTTTTLSSLFGKSTTSALRLLLSTKVSTTFPSELILFNASSTTTTSQSMRPTVSNAKTNATMLITSFLTESMHTSTTVSENGEIFSNQSDNSSGRQSVITPSSETPLAQQYSTSSSSSNDNVTTGIGFSLTSTPASISPENVDNRRVIGGHVYIRWGSVSCPLEAEQLYTGFAASGHLQHSGGATNTICLPQTPSWGSYIEDEDADRNLVYGIEYGSTDASFSSLLGRGQTFRNRGVLCSVCKATGRLSHVMIPGKNECFPGWTQEYRGYLMGSGYIHNHASELICVDSSPDHVANTDVVNSGNFLYFVEVRSGSLPSSSYPSGRELSCIVCTL